MIAPVAITGLAVASPYGWGIEPLMDGLLAGRSCVRTVTTFDTTDYPCSIAAPLEQIERPPGLPADVAEWTRLEQVTASLLHTAERDANLPKTLDRRRIGLVLGTSGESSWNWEMSAPVDGPICELDRRPLGTFVADTLQFHGKVLTVSTACSSGNSALALAQRWLALGWCDVCLVAGLDLGLTPLVLASFGNLRAVSRRNTDPTRASRPFDVQRDGFVLGEGGAAFVLERTEAARERGARVYGELLAVGLSADAHHPVVPNPTGESAARAIGKALKAAFVQPHEIDYLNAHGTGTPVGDAAEATAIRAALGQAWPAIPVSATKSLTGHLIAGASAVEAVICLATMQRGVIPATANLDEVGPACELNHVRDEPRDAAVRIAVSTSFGFGGSNTCAVFRAG